MSIIDLFIHIRQRPSSTLDGKTTVGLFVVRTKDTWRSHSSKTILFQMLLTSSVCRNTLRGQYFMFKCSRVGWEINFELKSWHYDTTRLVSSEPVIYLPGEQRHSWQRCSAAAWTACTQTYRTAMSGDIKRPAGFMFLSCAEERRSQEWRIKKKSLRDGGQWRRKKISIINLFVNKKTPQMNKRKKTNKKKQPETPTPGNLSKKAC